jgi:hypothetical protein
VATVLAVIGIAAAGVVNLYGMTAKAHRDWDADIDRIIARQQEKKRLVEMASLERGDLPGARLDVDAEPAVAAALTTGSFEDSDAEPQEQVNQKTQTSAGKKTSRRVARRGDHFVPAAFVTLPKFAAAATSTLLRLR